MNNQLTAEVRARYSVRGPRYTSYPTAPHFTETTDWDEIKRRWRDANADLSFYVHVPYCAVRCLFCGCHTIITKKRDKGAHYVDYLLKEIAQVGTLTNLSRPTRQLALGGGTPNFLEISQMRRLVDALNTHLNFANDAERSIEVDPRAITPEYVDALVDLGFNRFSMGVQDLDEDVMAAVNRPQSEATVTEVVNAIRDRAPLPINFDLIYGLPKQTESSWAATLKSVLAIQPTRLAVYGYAHVPWMKPHQKSLTRFEIPTDTLRGRLNQMARDAFTAAGYIAIGFDHYALPHDELVTAINTKTLHRNFMGYTTRRGLDMVACGVSGISAVNSTYTQNIKGISDWMGQIDASKPTWYRGLALSDEDDLRRDVITALSCNFELSLDQSVDGVSLKHHFAEELAGLTPMVNDGLINITDSALTVTDLGKPFVRNVCMAFDQYLTGTSTNRFSRTS